MKPMGRRGLLKRMAVAGFIPALGPVAKAEVLTSQTPWLSNIGAATVGYGVPTVAGGGDALGSVINAAARAVFENSRRQYEQKPRINGLDPDLWARVAMPWSAKVIIQAQRDRKAQTTLKRLAKAAGLSGWYDWIADA